MAVTNTYDGAAQYDWTGTYDSIVTTNPTPVIRKKLVYPDYNLKINLRGQ